MKTVDGGLHWQTISPDLTGSTHQPQDKKPQEPPTVENAKQRGYGVVFTIAPSALKRDLIWAGSDTGLIHITRDGGKTWKNVTPQGLTDWSKISLIEASHFDPAVAYAAVDRSRLDDQAPYIYRTRDYGATWQLITNGLTSPAFLRAVREDPQNKALLFAGTELGIYVSFDDGDHWQSLQLNLPVSSVRDLTIHGEDLVVATHGRSFWILDNITPLRQASEAAKANRFWLYRPAPGFRIDNDSFAGTPLPPEEPTAENPPTGAMLDYFLKSAARNITLEIFDSEKNLVRKFSSDDKHEDKHPEKHPSLPIAERWFPKPESLETTPGMHRFVWNLAWGGSGESTADEDSESRSPSGPKAIPGMYQVRLTVDGQTQSQSLKIIMDPRSPATPEILQQQLRLGQEIFAEAREARRVLAEIGSVEKQLAGIEQMVDEKHAALKPALADAQLEIAKIRSNKQITPQQPGGLQEGYIELTAALRVVKGGDRAVPSQAIAVYQESSQQVKEGIVQWTAFKQTKLPQLNQKLREGNLAPIAISEIEQDVEYLMSR
jgi:photosystem II stability/assembly factor-like uncharacterized protein